MYFSHIYLQQLPHSAIYENTTEVELYLFSAMQRAFVCGEKTWRRCRRVCDDLHLVTCDSYNSCFLSEGVGKIIYNSGSNRSDGSGGSGIWGSGLLNQKVGGFKP